MDKIKSTQIKEGSMAFMVTVHTVYKITVVENEVDASCPKHSVFKDTEEVPSLKTTFYSFVLKQKWQAIVCHQTGKFSIIKISSVLLYKK